ncbi:MAG: hypothetical protein HYV07_34205 [Deltaproteobacteria bacterium]|nr:hypothetical protein [Deltaproteobacteria bacterium]
MSDDVRLARAIARDLRTWAPADASALIRWAGAQPIPARPASQWRVEAVICDLLRRWP